MEGGIRRRFSRHSRTFSTSSTAVDPMREAGDLSSTSSPVESAQSGGRNSPGEVPSYASGIPRNVPSKRATTIADDAAARARQVKGRRVPRTPSALPSSWLQAVKDWRVCIEQITAAHKRSLSDTYKRYEHFATPEILDALFADRRSRQQVVSSWVRNFGALKRMQVQRDVAICWEKQFQNYDTLVQDLAEITELLAAEESGISLERDVLNHTITPRGDIVLEFCNPEMGWKPVLRYRVSSHMLSRRRQFSPACSAVCFLARTQSTQSVSPKAQTATKTGMKMSCLQPQPGATGVEARRKRRRRYCPGRIGIIGYAMFMLYGTVRSSTESVRPFWGPVWWGNAASRADGQTRMSQSVKNSRQVDVGPLPTVEQLEEPRRIEREACRHRSRRTARRGRPGARTPPHVPRGSRACVVIAVSSVP